MKIGETRRLKKVVLGVRVLSKVQETECTCKWEDDDGDSVTVTLAGDCPLHKPAPVSPPRNVIELFPQKNAVPDISMTSNHQIGDVALFEPNIDNIDATTMQLVCQDRATPVKIVGIKFVAGKVLYDVVVPYCGSETGWYDTRPIRDVDSYLVLKRGQV